MGAGERQVLGESDCGRNHGGEDGVRNPEQEEPGVGPKPSHDGGPQWG